MSLSSSSAASLSGSIWLKMARLVPKTTKAKAKTKARLLGENFRQCRSHRALQLVLAAYSSQHIEARSSRIQHDRVVTASNTLQAHLPSAKISRTTSSSRSFCANKTNQRFT
jgi:hypothetical protein